MPVFSRLPAFSKSGKYSFKEKEELMRTHRNDKLKRHIQKCSKERFISKVQESTIVISEIYEERILHSRKSEKWVSDVSIIIMWIVMNPLHRSSDRLVVAYESKHKR